MIPAPRPAVGPLPGDLYLDSAVPDCERVTLTRNGWSAQVTHVWTGTGWTRLVPGVVKEVPTNAPLPSPSVPGQRGEEPLVAAWRHRKRRREDELARRAAAAEAEKVLEALQQADADLGPGDGWERATAG